MHALGGEELHVPAAAAVAAVRPAGLHEFLPVEGDAAVAAVARLDRDVDDVYK